MTTSLGVFLASKSSNTDAATSRVTGDDGGPGGVAVAIAGAAPGNVFEGRAFARAST